MLAFGPVPSRRFGCSLGVNNVPAKRCTYSCVYCQLGPTTSVRVQRRSARTVQSLVRAVEERLASCREPVDYITVVPDGEPTLDRSIGPQIRALKAFGLPVAVITNGSLLWRPEVRADLDPADVVSVKVDSTDPRVWRRIDRPARQLRLHAILQGLELFTRSFSGEVWTETMLVHGFNDAELHLEKLAAFLERVAPARAFLAVPTRPPAVASVRPPSSEALVRAYRIFSDRLPRVELLAKPEEGSFGHGGDPGEDLLSILAVHPMREEVARGYLAEVGMDPALLDELVQAERIERIGYRDQTFVVARLEGVPARSPSKDRMPGSPMPHGVADVP